MIKVRLFVILLITYGAAFSQVDTVVVKDYTKVLITTNQDGGIEAVTNWSSERKVGFFLNELPRGQIRICNENELFVWVNGQLATSLEGCKTIDPSYLFSLSSNDTLFVSLSSSKLEEFKCEQVVYENFKVLRDEIAQPRSTRSAFGEFNVVAIITLLALFAIFASSFPSRFNFFINKTFSLKASSYQFINTSFYHRANVVMIFLVSATLAFESIYISQKIDLRVFNLPADLVGYLTLWGQITVWVFLFYLMKRVLIQVIASLFRMRKLKDWQLFDLVNFSGYFILIMFIIILWDYLLKPSQETWISPHFYYYFFGVLILFELWFIIKFVINSSYQKLLIISYLCATELIPSILIMGWFFK